MQIIAEIHGWKSYTRVMAYITLCLDVVNLSDSVEWALGNAAMKACAFFNKQ